MKNTDQLKRITRDLTDIAAKHDLKKAIRLRKSAEKKELPKLIKNSAGGYDLIADYSNTRNPLPVRIPTGNPEKSIQYWKKMKSLAQEALDELKAPVIHMIVLNHKGKVTKRETRIVRV